MTDNEPLTFIAFIIAAIITTVTMLLAILLIGRNGRHKK